ncbi:DNA methyltransferase [Halorhabdus sp. BNX81]|uniref:Eco57I restriction-modification methylase domain-containing protein n=1 Tax=Halorhabdus sp. BNX81 TaxID=2980181 RepID=UPI0023DD5FEA|nr:DNA methyltransferase [Halorhabdus sp. BNX81]WEL22348.1 Adenine-specific DNA-methyltransferase [Halorhabdus sp. BNX81]
MSQATLSDRPYVNSALFSSHYLDERVIEREEWDCDEEAREAMERLQSLYDLEGGVVDGYGEDALVDNWIDGVLDVLGFGTQKEVTLPDGDGYVDELLFGSSAERREAAKVNLDTDDTTDLFTRGVGLVEAKQWDADFTAEFSERRPYRNASHQIKHYLEKTPANIQWGVLTNGRKWRLYGTKDYETQTYFEIDLPEILESGDLEAFKYFYVFFRPDAFRKTAGTTFLDEVRSESETASQELGEDLQDNVFTALRVLGRGFVESNDMDIDPDDEAALAELKEQSLVLLYRLMFVLYAEARELIHPEEPSTQDEYEENFSLDALRMEIHDEIGEVDEGFESAFSEHSTTMWTRLEDLFSLIDEGEEDLGIPAYNGGLFDHDQHAFLTDHEVSNRYLAEVIYRLSTTENDDGRYVLADYADLDTRHLGSVYEGLLEHHFRIAPEQYAAVSADGGQVWKPAGEVTVADAVETVPEGGLYVVNDEGERKATGAYYTPDYVVTYIVEETIGPLVAEIHEDLQSQGFERGTQEYIGPFIRRVTDLQILDPAMGSGHFLTRATEYLANEVMVEVREVESAMGVAIDEQQMRRDIAKECIYGVDINGMAVELAKLSMWLETLATDQPLAFLDHHLKAGNSLVGSDVTDVLSEDDEEDDSGQLTLTQAFGRVRRDTLDHVMDLMADLLAMDNETLEDVHSMEDLYEQIQDDPLYRRLFELTNVHTAEQFGVDVPEDAYEQMADAIEDEAEWDEIQGEDWFEDAQALADEQTFFHWELEYPGVFFDEDGEERADAGFDAVIGNPPYIRIHRVGHDLTDYLFDSYGTCSNKSDLSIPFLERGFKLISQRGFTGYISTSQWVSTDYGESVRSFMSNGKVAKVLDFGTLPVFKGISTYPAIFILSGSASENMEYAKVENESQLTTDAIDRLQFRKLSYERFDREPWVFDGLDLRATISERSKTAPLSSLGEFKIGALTGMDDVFVVDQDTIDEHDLEEDLIFPYAYQGEEIQRYATVEPDEFVIYPYSEGDDGDSKLLPEQVLESEYPNIHSYFERHKQDLRERQDSRKFYAKGPDWYRFLRQGRFDYITPPKLLIKGVATHSCVGFLPDDTLFSGANCPGLILNSENISQDILLGILNSNLISEYLVQVCPAKMQNYTRFNANNLNDIPIVVPEQDVALDMSSHLSEQSQKTLKDLIGSMETSFYVSIERGSEELRSLRDQLISLNLSLLDHLGSYSDGPTLADVGLTQPPEGAADSILTQTTEERPNLRVGEATVVRESPTAVEIRLTARYKPDDSETRPAGASRSDRTGEAREIAHETDQWGYTETEPLPALRISDLTAAEADLLEHFVPVAVDEAGGFADFRETATKTNSPVDRLRKLTLPAVDDVQAGLESYVETKERADELEAKLERTDDLIDEIVYELYGLTDEEIRIVEEAVGE